MINRLASLIFCLLTLSAPAVDWTLPAANQGAWVPGTNVGVNGGVDQYRVGGASARTTIVDATLTPYFADKTGAMDAKPAIQAALDATGTGTVIKLPAGTYRLDSQIEIDQYDSGKTIRGDGATTIIYSTQTDGRIFSYTGSNETNYYANTVTGTKTKGTSGLTISDSSEYSVGDLAVISVENEENNTRIEAGAAPTWSNSGFRTLRQVTVRITAVGSGTSITVDPPLPWDCTAYETIIRKSTLDWRIERFGVEDMRFAHDTTNKTLHFIDMASCVECWVYGCSVRDWRRTSPDGSCVFVNNSYKCEVRHCDFRVTLDSATVGDDGAVQLASSTSILVEDNISTGFDSAYYNSGKTYNCAILYNYFDSEQGNYPGHNGHNSLDLLEGNVADNFHLDAYHGSGSHQTFYRNWLYDNGLYIKRFMYYMAVAGNIFGQDGVRAEGNAYGYPNIGNNDYVGTCNHFTGDPHVDWNITGTLTTRTSDTAGVITVVGGDLASAPGAIISARWNSQVNGRIQMTLISRAGQALTVSGGSGDILPAEGTTFSGVWLFAAGYQELDNGVTYTMTRADNYHSVLSGTGAIQNNTTDVLPSSLAHTFKPAYFGALAWPPVNPDSVTGITAAIIPAGYRFLNDADPGGGGGGGSTGTITATTVNAGATAVRP